MTTTRPPGAASGAAGQMPVGTALDRSQPLSALLQRLRESQARFDAVTALLPSPLRAAVRPGPVSDDGWVLLAAHGAAASKLRQLLPRLAEALQQQGWPATAIKVRVQPPQPSQPPGGAG